MAWVTGEGYYYGDVPDGVTIKGEEIHKYMLSNFDFFDQNGNGAISEEEFVEGVKALGVESKYDNYYDDLYKRYVRRYTGIDLQLTKTELEQGIAKEESNKVIGVNSTRDNSYLEIFNKIDTNGNGMIDWEENTYEAYKRYSSKLPCDGVSDINDDDKLSFGEYMYAVNKDKSIKLSDIKSDNLRQALQRYDLDGDGWIRKDEIKNYDTAMNENKAHDTAMNENKAHDKEMNESSGLSTGAIVGIVIGAVCVVGLIIALVAYLLRDKRKNKEESAEQENVWDSFDKKEKDIDYSAKTNLHSINQLQDKQIECSY